MSTRAFRLSRLVIMLIASILALAGMQTVAMTSASADPAPAAKVVSAVPSKTPAVNDGSVQAIAQVGDTVVAGGDFTTVTPVNGSATTQNYVVAFSASTGQLVSGFAADVNGEVTDVIAGLTPGTVYVAGKFTRWNGSPASHIALVDTATGQLVSGFRAGSTNGVVNTIVTRGDQVLAGGLFTTAGGLARGGLASFDGATGAVTGLLTETMTQGHNTASDGAHGGVGARDMEVTPDGATLIVIGNFRFIDGLDRDQIAQISLGSGTSNVRADWQTDRYKPLCFNWAYDSYMRGISISPDGSYFVVNSTGGKNVGSLCDTSSRWETSASGSSLQPTWVDSAGGDTLWAVEVTDAAVYVGGHQRWLNNGDGNDNAGQGAVSRPGLAALDPRTGVPLSWNPGRNPRGAAVYALNATSSGLWMGSDTEFIGPSYNYKRPRIAFFPADGGAAVASDATAGLPGTAFLGGRNTTTQNVVFRMNAGGSQIAATDGGPAWQANSSASTTYGGLLTGTKSWSANGASVDSTVPSTTPKTVFDTERRAALLSGLSYRVSVASGLPLQVRLYFANRDSSTNTVGKRVFDVKLDGATVLSNFDAVAAVGNNTGTMRAFNITSDGTVNIDFTNRKSYAELNAIEIIRTDVAPPTTDDGSLATVALTASSATPGAALANQGLDYAAVRGSFVAGGKLWYGKSNGTFNSRTFDGQTLGAEVNVSPYDDPLWDGVDTGSGNTYDGTAPSLYGQLGSVTGMAYANGRLYYYRGDGTLHWRWFSTDSGIIGSDEFSANGSRSSWSNTGGMFAADGKLYYATPSDGNLNAIALSASGEPTGGSTVVDGPSISHTDYRTRTLFFAKAYEPPHNDAPTATFTSSCVDLVCTIDGSASSDPDGTIASYAWTVDGAAAGSAPSFVQTFTASGTHTIALTVTDNVGATTTTEKTVTVTAPPVRRDVSFVAKAATSANAAQVAVTVPAEVQSGDLLLLSATLNNSPTVTAPAGWTQVDTKSTTNLTTYVWAKVASATDAGTTASVGLGAVGKSGLALTAYRGVDTSTLAFAHDASVDASTASHTAPSVTVPAGAWVVSFFSEKSTATSAWTTGSGLTSRATAYATGSARVSTLVGDSNGPLSGVVAGATAVADTTSSRGVNWSIVLPAANQ